MRAWTYGKDSKSESSPLHSHKGDAGVLLVSKTVSEPAIGPLALPSPEAGIGAHPHLGQSGPRLGLPGLSQKRALGAGNAEAA